MILQARAWECHAGAQYLESPGCCMLADFADILASQCRVHFNVWKAAISQRKRDRMMINVHRRVSHMCKWYVNACVFVSLVKVCIVCKYICTHQPGWYYLPVHQAQAIFIHFLHHAFGQAQHALHDASMPEFDPALM